MARWLPHPRLMTVLLVAALFGGWEAAAGTGLFGPSSLPRASQVVEAFPEVVTSPTFVPDVLVTLLQIGIAFLVSLAVGVLLGYLMWRFRTAEQALEPYLAALAGFPAIIFFPVFVGIFGLSNVPLILVAALLATVPLALTTTTALQSVPDVLLRMSYSLQMSPLRRYRSVILPSAVPHFVPGLRLGILFSIIGVVSSQFLLGTRGLGFRISLLYERFEMIDMYVYVIIVVLVATVAHLALRALEFSVRRDLS